MHPEILGAVCHAKRLIRAIKESRQAAPVCETPDITLGEHAPRWIEGERTYLRARTVKGYEQLLPLYIVPAPGRAKLRATHAGHVRAPLTGLRRKGLAKNRGRLVRATLSIFFSAAVDDSILTTNPARALSHGRRRTEKISKPNAGAGCAHSAPTSSPRSRRRFASHP